MEQSLFLQYVQKFFPQLVISVAENIEKRNEYLFKGLLNPSYSVDGRWESISGEYNRVAADVVAMDSPLPLKSRDALTSASGNIPKVGMELALTEKQMSDIDAMIAQGIPVNTVVQKIFEDTPRVIAGVYERMEAMFLEGLSTGVSLADSNNVGTGIRVDYGYLAANKFGVPTVWAGNASSAKAVDDLQKVVDKAADDGNRIIKAYADRFWFAEFAKNDQARAQFAFLQGIIGNAPALTSQQVSAVVENMFGFPVELVDRAIKTEANGVKSVSKPWAEGTIVFVCDNQVGNLVWTRPVEMNHPVAGVSYETADNYILVSKYRVNRPSLKEYTASQARVIPVISNPERIYTLNIKTVQA